MCGIFGWVSNQSEKYSIKPFKKNLYHRGPDKFNTVRINSHVLFGHTRLAINDLSSLGSQPMIDKISQNAIVFNGEIYNFKRLRKELLGLGVKFEGKSDTEVLLKGYSIWGKSILDRIIGMFSFVIWDAREKLLFIARDRLGEKPCYFTNLKNGDFVFSSELTPLKLMDGFNDEIDPNFLTEYLSYGYNSNNQCIYKNVKKMKPAHYLIVKDGKITEEVEYWKLSKFFKNKKKYKSIDEAADIFINLLNDSIEGQLISDVSLGGLLSGGVDSGIVLSAMMQQNTKTNSFCAGFVEKDFDESSQAYSIAKKIGTKHHSFDILLPSFQEIIEPMRGCDEPFSDTSMIPTYFLSKYTREHVTVALTGDGGDELFGGYPTYTADIIHKFTNFLPRTFFKILEKLIVFLPSSHKKVGFDYRIKALIKGLQFSYPEAHQSWRRLFFDDEISKLINGNNLKNEVENFQTRGKNNFWKDVEGCHYLDQSMYVDIKTWLIDDILYKVDRMSMAHSLELRAPLLDHRIVEFAASLPVKFKKDIFKSKKLLKHVAKKFYGLNYNPQKKKGFNAPMSRWINLYKRDFYDYLVNSQLYDKEEIKRLIDNHINKKQDNSFKISCLTSYAAWVESNNLCKP
jgi:asparagine synthase (glutamine-hydrolysing)